MNGYIKDATPNLKRLLYEPADGKFEDRHIHEFFINELKASHQVLMDSTDKIVNILGVQRPFFAMRFGEFLKQIQIRLKSSSSLINDLEYYAEMTAIESLDDLSLVL